VIQDFTVAHDRIGANGTLATLLRQYGFTDFRHSHRRSRPAEPHRQRIPQVLQSPLVIPA